MDNQSQSTPADTLDANANLPLNSLGKPIKSKHPGIIAMSQMNRKGIGGKPRKYPTPESLQDKIDEYFALTPIEKVTMSGLLIHLDLDKDMWSEYFNREEYRLAVKNGKLRVENAWEIRLMERGRSGDIFALKQFGWKDSIEVNQEISTSVTHKLDDSLTSDWVEHLKAKTAMELPEITEN